MAKEQLKDKSDHYIKDKAAKKKSGTKALVMLLVLCFVVVSVVAKITLTGTLKPDFFKGEPSSSDVYAIAKEFIQPTLKSSSADYADSKYQFGKQADSVYVIQSSVTSKNESGEKVNTDFKIALKYNGGQVDKQKNWALVDLSEHQ